MNELRQSAGSAAKPVRVTAPAPVLPTLLDVFALPGALAVRPRGAATSGVATPGRVWAALAVAGPARPILGRAVLDEFATLSGAILIASPEGVGTLYDAGLAAAVARDPGMGLDTGWPPLAIGTAGIAASSAGDGWSQRVRRSVVAWATGGEAGREPATPEANRTAAGEASTNPGPSERAADGGSSTTAPVPESPESQAPADESPANEPPASESPANEFPAAPTWWAGERRTPDGTVGWVRVADVLLLATTAPLLPRQLRRVAAALVRDPAVRSGGARDTAAGPPAVVVALAVGAPLASGEPGTPLRVASLGEAAVVTHLAVIAAAVEASGSRS